MTRQLPIIAAGSSRASSRAPMRLLALITLDDGQPCRVTVKNLSAEGFRFETPVRLRAGQKLGLTIGGHPAIPASIIHSQGETHGCRFDRRMDAALLQSIVAAGPFAAREPVSTPPPAVWRWPGWMRAATILSASLGGWTVASACFQALIR